MQCKVIGIDLAKHTFQVCVLGIEGSVVSNKKVSRKRLMFEITQSCPEAPIAMEACASAHHWGRRFESMGRRVLLIPAQHVKAFVGHQKNDANDAVAICEAAQRPRIHPVAVKSVEKQDIQSLRRIRQRAVDNRTALGNQIRGLSGEYGLCFRQSLRLLRCDLLTALDDTENELSPLLREELRRLYGELVDLDTTVKRLDRKLLVVLREREEYARLKDIPGIGPLTASALISELGDGRRFSNGREMSAWCGLIPRQHSSGGRERLLGLTKNGNRELRTLLIHGARAVVYRYKNRQSPLGRWLDALIARRGVHKAIVALANKLARISWAVLHHQQAFDMKKAFA